MAGALGMMMGRRRYDRGGDVEEDGGGGPAPDDDDLPLPLPPVPPAGGGQHYSMVSPAPTRGALGLPPIDLSPRAVSNAIDQGQQNLDRYQQAQQVMKAGGVQVPDINLPLLAAAAGFLAPTKTGSFSESIANAMAGATPVLQAERKRKTDEELRNRLYDLRATHEANYGRRVDSLEVQSLATAALKRAQAAAAAAGGGKGGTRAAVLAGAVNDLASQINPATGQPFGQAEAYRIVTGVAGREANQADRNEIARSGISVRDEAAKRRHALELEKFQATEAWRAAQIQLRERGFNEAQIRAVAANAMRAVAMGTMKQDQAIEAALLAANRAASTMPGVSVPAIDMPIVEGKGIDQSKLKPGVTYRAPDGRLGRWNGKAFEPVQ